MKYSMYHLRYAVRLNSSELWVGASSKYKWHNYMPVQNYPSMKSTIYVHSTGTLLLLFLSAINKTFLIIFAYVPNVISLALIDK